MILHCDSSASSRRRRRRRRRRRSRRRSSGSSSSSNNNNNNKSTLFKGVQGSASATLSAEDSLTVLDTSKACLGFWV